MVVYANSYFCRCANHPFSAMLKPLLSTTRVWYPEKGPAALATVARLLGHRLKARVSSAQALPADGLRLDVTGGPWAPTLAPAPTRHPWTWAQLGQDGTGALAASHPALLYGWACALLEGAVETESSALSAGLRGTPAFAFHRPLFDHMLTQVSRTARGFEAEAYVAALARAGFTDLEVNGLATPVPFEPGVPTEYYNQFYSYCPGFNHFVESTLTRGLYPSEYLQANLRRVQKLAHLGRAYGLEPGLLCFEPRSLPETFFQRYPTLRGARIDHPFRSHLPRYTLAQDHPAVRDHYRQLMRAMMEAVPELSYLSVWSNDSGAGFEHTASLYVGRNGGPYLIREWREHDQIAETAGRSALRWLRLMQETAAEVNPGFEVSLRIEPFKVEHDTLLSGMGDGLTIEAPSLLVRGYELPYAHPRYPEQTGAAGTIFHAHLDPEEKVLLDAHRAAGFEPKLTYSAASSFNTEPLLGIPFPHMLHRKLVALREAGFQAASAFGGLLHVEKTPYWPHPEVIRAVQFTPELPLEKVLAQAAARWAGADAAPALVEAWGQVEEAVSYLPIVPLYSNFGFVWLRTWVRPLVPDIEAIPLEDRRYYERFLVSTANNPNINDLGRDVLFELISEESGRQMAGQFDDNVLPRLDTLHAWLTALAGKASDPAAAVFADLRDRAEALRCWATTQRNTCAWVAGVYGFLRATSNAERERHRAYVQAMIDLDLENTRRLLHLWETSPTEFILVSDVGETSFIFGDNLGGLLRRKLALTEAYRYRDPYIDPDIVWRLP